MKKVLAIILGGGAGTRLYPLTKLRAKPAVPLAGKYRLIDIPVSNCINSEIFKPRNKYKNDVIHLENSCSTDTAKFKIIDSDKVLSRKIKSKLRAGNTTPK